MKSISSKIIAALILAAALAGCASTGEQESATVWMDKVSHQGPGD